MPCTNSPAHKHIQTACTFTASSSFGPSHWRLFSHSSSHADTRSPCAGTPAVRPRISGAARCVSIVALPPPPPRLPARTHTAFMHTRKSERESKTEDACLCMCLCVRGSRALVSQRVCVCARACVQSASLHAASIEVSEVYASTSMHCLQLEPLDQPSRGGQRLCAVPQFFYDMQTHTSREDKQLRNTPL